MQLWRVRTCTLSLSLSLSPRTLRLPQPESQPVSNTQCVLKSGLAWAQGGTVSFQGREAEAPVTEQPWWILKLLDSLCGSWFYKAEMAAKSACNPKTQPPPIRVDIGIVEEGGVGVGQAGLDKEPNTFPQPNSHRAFTITMGNSQEGWHLWVCVPLFPTSGLPERCVCVFCQP